MFSSAAPRTEFARASFAGVWASAWTVAWHLTVLSGLYLSSPVLCRVVSRVRALASLARVRTFPGGRNLLAVWRSFDRLSARILIATVFRWVSDGSALLLFPGPLQACRRVTWLILPVVICLSQRLSHACLSTSLSKVKPRMAH